MRGLSLTLFVVLAPCSWANDLPDPAAPTSPLAAPTRSSRLAHATQADSPVVPVSYRTYARATPWSAEQSAAVAADRSDSSSGIPEPPRELGVRAVPTYEPPRNEAEEEEEGEDAEDEEEDEEVEEEDAPSTLLGECWHQWGPITAEYLYTGEVFNNTRGGISTKRAARYRGNFDLTLALDTAAACWWEGGRFFTYLQQSHGQTLTEDFVGDGQYYSNIHTGDRQDITQLAEYWYQHSFGDDMLIVQLGRQDANENFAYADLGGDFVNASFVTLANVPLPTWPYQTLGLSSLHQVNDRLRLGGGVYDHGRDHGLWWSSTVSRGMFLIGQIDYQPFEGCEEALLTLVRLGAWYTSSDTLAVDEATVHEGNYGFFATLDRMLWTEGDDTEQGLGTFCQLTWAPADRNLVDVGYGAGLVYRGLVPCRDEDTLGVGFSAIEFSSTLRDLTGQTSENVLELFYKVRVRRWLALQPDLQYIARPSGQERDSLVAGLRFEANF